MRLMQMLVLSILLVASTQAAAIWTLDNDNSSIIFVSTKAIDIAEVHRFNQISGRISDKGKAVVTIEMASVDTGVPIRDERMGEMLFETEIYPLATIRAKIDTKTLDSMTPGSTQRLATELTLELHGARVIINTEVIIAMLDEKLMMVTSADPIIVSAASAGLTSGIEALRKVVNLPSIGQAVPVSFVLMFEKSD